MTERINAYEDLAEAKDELESFKKVVDQKKLKLVESTNGQQGSS